jgi:3-phosphoshikimate 1-carboxyvinyltransferase
LQDLPPQSREIKAMQIAEKRLIRAIEAGARYVDVELEAQKQMSKRVRQAAHENGTVFIRSYHDFEATDSLEALKAIVEKCVYHGADMVKIATAAHSQADVEKVMALYDWCREEKRSGNERIGSLYDGGLVAFCMGEEARQSRLDCLKHGSPYTYAALNEEEIAAPGQWTLEDMREAVYDHYFFLNEELTHMPVSKSYAQRAIIAAALAEGTSTLYGYTVCDDSESAVHVAKALGATVEQYSDILEITGIGATLDCLDIDELHVGESGLLTRMMIPLMAQLNSKPVRFTGEKTLLRRSLTGAKEIMEAFGAEMDSDIVPLTVKGPLNAGRAEISGKHGSQIISGLLMALPFAEKNSSIIVRDPKSIPYMFITVEVLKKFGIKIGNDMLGGPDFLASDGDWSLCTEMVFKVKGGQKLKAAKIDLEADWSAAANFLVLGAVFGKVEIDGLDTTSLQADLSIMDILMDAGASISQVDGDRGRITVQRAPLKAFKVDASNCPDLFPIVSILAAFCQGTNRIAGVGRLANKESDRAKAIVGMLTQMGVEVRIEGDEMVIEGQSLAQRILNNNLLKGGDYTSHHDHRMVLALNIAALGSDGDINIDDEDCVSKSFPDFHTTLKITN